MKKDKKAGLSDELYAIALKAHEEYVKTSTAALLARVGTEVREAAEKGNFSHHLHDGCLYTKEVRNGVIAGVKAMGLKAKDDAENGFPTIKISWGKKDG